MSGTTSIQWTDRTWNPTTGCTRVSAGCDHCYAFQLHDQRHIAWKRGGWPLAPAQYHQPFSKVQLLPQRLNDPLHWRKPCRVFVDSMSDLFHEDVPDTYIAQVLAVMSIADHLTFQVLTKRPERMRELLNDITFQGAVDFYVDRIGREHNWVCTCEVYNWPLPNVWLGTSVENQEAANERIPHLLATPAAVRFLSCEPLLGRLDLTHWLGLEEVEGWAPDIPSGYDPVAPTGLDWVIIGGESGPHAREMRLEWARDLIDQCEVADVRFFVKQLGSVWAKEWGAKDRHGGDESEWLDDFRVRMFPKGGAI